MPHTFHHGDFPLAKVLEAKGGRTVSVCIPARDEGSTVGSVVRAVVQPFLARPAGSGLVDEVLVLDDGSTDDTAEQAGDAGAQVVRGPSGPGGKGQAMAAALAAPHGDLMVFLDADVANTTPAFVTGMLGPLLFFDDIALVKGFYTRPLHGDPTGGGRVTELVARPVLELLFPELSEVRQPLAGETAAHRWVFEKVGFADGYGVELGLLIDVAAHFGAESLAQVDLGVRIHRNRPLHELRPQATDVLRAALERAWPPVPAPRVTHRRLQPGPALLPLRRRRRPDRRARPAAGWSPPSAPLLAGTDATWVSVTMGAADRAAVEAGRMVDDQGLTLLPVSIDDDTYRPAYDVVANTTLWYCHHHLFDLPRRPRFDRHWRQAWDGYRGYNQAVADAVIASRGRGRRVLVQDYHFSLLGSMLAEARPDLRTVHFWHIPFADPNMLGVLPDYAAGELLAGLAGFGACGFHCRQWEAGFRACFAAAGLRAGAPHLRLPALPDHEGLLAEAACPTAPAAAEALRAETGGAAHHRAGRPRRASKNIVRGMLAFEELLTTYPAVAGRGGARGAGLPVAAGAGRLSRLRGRSGAHGRADQRRLGHRGLDARSSCTSKTTGPARWPR